MICKRCGKDVSNGVGPADLPVVTKFLSKLPSSHIFKNAADWHDYDYHLGTTEIHRRIADDRFYKEMKQSIKLLCKWYLVPWYKLQAYRNYLFVRKYGGNFFNYKGCQY